jgi:hypothetical protein
VRIVWGDGAADTVEELPAGQRDFVLTHRYADDPAGSADQYQVQVTVDDGVASVTDNAVAATVHNVAPGLYGLTVTGQLNENDEATLSGFLFDSGVQDTFTLDVDWGDGAHEQFAYPAGTQAFTRTHRYLDDGPGPSDGSPSYGYAVHVRVADDDGGAATADLLATVNNVAPVLGGVSATAVQEGGTTTLTGTITDPGTLDTFSLAVDWGDGHVDHFAYPAGTTAFSQRHAYVDNPSDGTNRYAVSLSLLDDDAGAAATTTTVTVTNANPMVLLAGGGTITVTEGQPVSFAGQFQDAGVDDTWRGEVTIAPGVAPLGGSAAGGASLPLMLRTDGTFDGTVIFSQAGWEDLTVTVRDNDGGVGTARVAVQVLPTAVVTDVVRNGELDRPNQLASVSFTFSANVGASLDPADLALFDHSSQQWVDVSAAVVTWDGARRTATWDLSGLALHAGYYTPVLRSAGIKDNLNHPLDQDGPGGTQDDFQSAPMLVAPAGDADADGVVGLSDLMAIESSFGMPGAGWRQGDFNGDGEVDFMDYLALKEAYGQSVAMPGPVPLLDGKASSSLPVNVANVPVVPTATVTPPVEAAAGSPSIVPVGPAIIGGAGEPAAGELGNPVASLSAPAATTGTGLVPNAAGLLDALSIVPIANSLQVAAQAVPSPLDAGLVPGPMPRRLALTLAGDALAFEPNSGVHGPSRQSNMRQALLGMKPVAASHVRPQVIRLGAVLPAIGAGAEQAALLASSLEAGTGIPVDVLSLSDCRLRLRPAPRPQ